MNLRGTALFGLLAAHGCAAPTAPTPGEELDITCTGKCDALSSVRSLFRDVRDIDTGDLMNFGAELATDELNDHIATEHARAELGAPRVFALPERVEQRSTESLRDINSLVTGLASRFGEQELTTHVNRVRRDHLASGADAVYAETSFAIRGNVGWSKTVDGLLEDLTAQVSVGFSGDLQARTIFAYPNELEANTVSILRAVKESRGFILPRSTDDIRAMKPGELIALRGHGSLGINFGAGVPILVAQPASFLTYNIVVSGALRSHVEGDLDIQLIRLEGDSAVIDVGTERATLRSAQLAVRDGWGVSGLIDARVEIGGLSVDVGRLIERALERQLNAKLSLLEARLERTTRASRISLARFRIDLSQAGPELDAAIAQALKGDVRLAQYLGQRGYSGVRQEFDLLRSGISTVSYAGIDLFGMSFFAEAIDREGTVVVQTPGQSQAILFDTHESRRGLFFSRHGYTRADLAGLSFDPATGGVRGDTNLFLQVLEGRIWMSRDVLLDQLDPLLVALAGDEAFRALEDPANDLERHVRGACRSEAFNPCYQEVLRSAEVIALRDQATAAFESRLPGNLPRELRDLAVAAAQLRVAAQATFEPHATLVGPRATVFADQWLDDGALAELFTRVDPVALQLALERHVELVSVDRHLPEDALVEIRAVVLEDERDDIVDVVNEYARARDAYQRLLAVEEARIEGLGVIGDNALEIQLPIEEGRIVYEQAAARSVAQARAEVVREMFHRMRDDAADISGVRPQHAVFYTLLALTRHERKDLRVDIDMDLGNDLSQSYDHYRAAGYRELDARGAGPEVRRIGGGLFDIDALLRIDDI